MILLIHLDMHNLLTEHVLGAHELIVSSIAKGSMTILQPKKVMQKVGLDITYRHSSDYGRRPNTIFPLSFDRLTAEVTDVPFLETKQRTLKHIPCR